MTLLIIILLLLIVIPSVFFFIFVKKFNGLKEVSIIFGSLIILVVAFYYLFQSSDSKIIEQKLTESNLKLSEKFKILNSQDDQTLVDYYTEYEILISDKDKLKLINNIKTSRKFKKLKPQELDSFWTDEYEKEFMNNQTIRNYNINECYYRSITFPNSSRKLETEIDTIKNILKIKDAAD